MIYLCIDLRREEADEVDLLPSVVCVRLCLCATLVFGPSSLHCISIKRHMPPFVITEPRCSFLTVASAEVRPGKRIFPV